MNTTYSSRAEARSAMRSADERRRKALATAREIADRCSNGGTEKPGDEQNYKDAVAAYDREAAIMHEARAYLDDRETEDAFNAAARKSGRGTKDSSDMTELRYGKPLPTGMGFVDLYDEKRTIEDTGRYLEALIRGDYATLAEMRATLTTGAATKGAEFINPEIAAPLLDMARANTVLVKAGARVVPLQGNTTKFPVHSGDLVLAARDEAGAVAATDVTLGSVTMTPRSYMAMAKVSREMLADSSVDVPNYLAGVAAARGLHKPNAVEVIGSILSDLGLGDDAKGHSRECLVEGCRTWARSSGLCHKHHEAARRAGEEMPAKRIPSEPSLTYTEDFTYPRYVNGDWRGCKAEGCRWAGQPYAGGMCEKHFKAYKAEWQRKRASEGTEDEVA